jgi:single-strand DNA-binding protein
MPNYNRVILMGNLTRDPELRYTPNGTAVADIGVAVNRRYRSQDEQREETTFVDVTAWGRQAEVINEYFSKGRPIFLEGRLKLDQWTNSEGQNRSKLRVVLENFQFVTPKGDSGSSSRRQDSRRSGPPTRDQDDFGDESPPDDDVPF